MQLRVGHPARGARGHSRAQGASSVTWPAAVVCRIHQLEPHTCLQKLATLLPVATPLPVLTEARPFTLSAPAVYPPMLLAPPLLILGGGQYPSGAAASPAVQYPSGHPMGRSPKACPPRPVMRSAPGKGFNTYTYGGGSIGSPHTNTEITLHRH